MSNEGGISKFINFIKNAMSFEEEDNFDFFAGNPELLKYAFGNISLYQVNVKLFIV